MVPHHPLLIAPRFPHHPYLYHQGSPTAPIYTTNGPPPTLFIPPRVPQCKQCTDLLYNSY